MEFLHEVESAVSTLLQLGADTWTEVPTSLSLAERHALEAIMVAGYGERRITLSSRLPGGEFSRRVVFESPGGMYPEKVLREVVREWWASLHRTDTQEDSEEEAPPSPVVAKLREEWRLTPEGLKAKRRTESRDERERQALIEFVLRQWNNDSVRKGEGPDSVRIENATSGPLEVVVNNWRYGVEAFAKVLNTALLSLWDRMRGGDYVFAQRGRSWVVRAFGESGMCKDKMGCRYLAVLLAAPGTPLSVREVHAEAVREFFAQGGGGHNAPSPTVDSTVVAIRRIRRATAYVYRELRSQGLMAIAKHLRTSIHFYGDFVEYRPTEKIPWRQEL